MKGIDVSRADSVVKRGEYSFQLSGMLSEINGDTFTQHEVIRSGNHTLDSQ